MKFIVESTGKVLPGFWAEYVRVFNENFGAKFTSGDFEKKYRSPVLGGAIHAFCLTDDDKLIGATSILPLNYMVDGEIVTGGVSCDSFVDKDHRKKNPFLFRTLLAKVESHALEIGVNFVISVPNENSFLYTVHCCNWKLVGEYDFYIVPVGVRSRLGGNLIGRCASFLVSSVTRVFFLFGSSDGKETQKRIRICRDEPYLKYRLAQADYHRVIQEEREFIYRIYEEAGTPCAYLMDYQPRSPLVLHKALKYIFERNRKEIDIILFLGVDEVIHLPALKIPKCFEPRKMRFTIRLLNEKYSAALDIKNWELGILLMDTR